MNNIVAFNPCFVCPEDGKCSMCELNMYRQGTLSNPQWISVEDRLPETDDTNSYTYNVLVFIPEREGCRQHGMYLAKLKYVKASDGKDNFWNIPTQECEWTVWGWSYFKHPVVTHWMPLPEPPKMKGGEE